MDFRTHPSITGANRQSRHCLAPRVMMAAKMEVLKRSDTAHRTPRVLLNPSLSLSFQIPASLRHTERVATPINHIQSQLESMRLHADVKNDRAMQLTPTTNGVFGVGVEKADTNEEEDEDESWEDRDWSRPTVASSAASSLPRMVLGTSALHDDDEWEEATDANDLPDDFPVLIVNLSRLRDLHFRSESGAHTIAMDTEQQLREFYETVKATLHDHFSQMTEVLFEQEICLHTHYGTHRAMLANLHDAYPSHVFALIDYPTEIAGLALHEYLHVLESPTQWSSVNYIKDALRKCSRDLEWKFEVAIELEKLAQQEHEARTHELTALSDEIDELTRLRDSFRVKLSQTNQNQYMLLRKLEDIEARLLNVLDLYLTEPELTAKETQDLVGFTDATPSMQMKNVLDMVVAMVFSRLPRDYRAQPTPEAHFGMLLDHHIHVRRLWKKDFGRLPSRTLGVSSGSGEEDTEAKEEDGLGVETMAVGEAEEKEMEEEEEEEEEEDASWEAIASEDEVDDVEEEEQKEEVETAPLDDLDGYGADDSGASDSNSMESRVAQPAARRRRRPKRTRHFTSDSPQQRSRSPLEEKGEEETPQQARERELEAFMYGDSSSDASGEDPKPMLFSGFARTGALDLLRRAKENEGF